MQTARADLRAPSATAAAPGFCSLGLGAASYNKSRANPPPRSSAQGAGRCLIDASAGSPIKHTNRVWAAPSLRVGGIGFFPGLDPASINNIAWRLRRSPHATDRPGVWLAWRPAGHSICVVLQHPTPTSCWWGWNRLGQPMRGNCGRVLPPTRLGWGRRDALAINTVST